MKRTLLRLAGAGAVAAAVATVAGGVASASGGSYSGQSYYSSSDRSVSYSSQERNVSYSSMTYGDNCCYWNCYMMHNGKRVIWYGNNGYVGEMSYLY